MCLWLCCELFLRKLSDILRCCGPYSYNSYHIFSHIAITEDQEEDEEDEDSDYMAYVHISSILDGQALITRGTVLGQRIMSILYIVCMLIYFLKKKEVYIQFSLLDVYLYFLCFIIYTFTMSGLLSTMIYCVTTHFPFFCCCPFTFFFYHEEIYLSKEKQCYLFVMLPCKYAVSPPQAVNCIPSCTNLLVFRQISITDVYVTHTLMHVQAVCLFIGNISIILCTEVLLVCLQLIITDQRDFLNGFTQRHCKSCNTAVMEWKEIKNSHFFSFLCF